MFDKDITVINKYLDNARTIQYKLSTLKGFWGANNGVSLNGTMLTKADALEVRILMSEESYQKPEEFLKSPSGWTLKNDDYLVKGIIKDFTTITDLLNSHKNTDEVIKITNIATKDYGSKDMWHWAIIGK